MGAVHVEQYTHTVHHYVAVQMRTIPTGPTMGAVHTHCTAFCSCTDEDNSPTGPTMGAVHVEQYTHTLYIIM
jgi:hypothetical protein